MTVPTTTAEQAKGAAAAGLIDATLTIVRRFKRGGGNTDALRNLLGSSTPEETS